MKQTIYSAALFNILCICVTTINYIGINFKGMSWHCTCTYGHQVQGQRLTSLLRSPELKAYWKVVCLALTKPSRFQRALNTRTAIVSILAKLPRQANARTERESLLFTNKIVFIPAATRGYGQKR